MLARRQQRDPVVRVNCLDRAVCAKPIERRARLAAQPAARRCGKVLMIETRLMIDASTSDFRGVALPRIMYGTAWKEDRTKPLVLEAIAAGFRAFDTANQRKHYVEKDVGAAVRT